MTPFTIAPSLAERAAAVATARTMAVLVWHLLSEKADYLRAKSALVAHKLRALEL